jgi:hypothetical protein
VGTFLAKLLVYSTPYLLVGLSFLILDPFKVVRHHEAFGSHNPVSINVDYVATETYLRNRERLQYDSFIFGSSRALAFRTADWRSYIPDSVPLLYNANAESLFGVWAKVRFIDQLGDRIENALFLVDEGLLQEVTNSQGHLYIKDPRISRESWTSFYLTFFNAYLSDFFFVKYLDYRIFATYRSYMAEAINLEPMEIGPSTNDLVLAGWDRELERDPDGYYERRRSTFEVGRDSRGVRTGERVIGEPQRALLGGIRDVWERHGTRVRIVVSPNFDQVPLHREDLAVLCELFGAANVFDFSGVNEITADARNYYEPLHFRPSVGRRILEAIYGDGAPIRVASHAKGRPEASQGGRGSTCGVRLTGNG